MTDVKKASLSDIRRMKDAGELHHDPAASEGKDLGDALWLKARLQPSAYLEAIGRNPLSREALEGGAKALAEVMAGGTWEASFTTEQRDLWRKRVTIAMGVV